MLSFFKVFGQGILYIIGLPFILAFLVLYAVYCFAMFCYMAFKNIVIFFSGGTPNGDMKEDVEAKRILLARQEKQEAVNDLLLRAYAPQQAVSVQPTTTFAQQNEPTNINQSEASDFVLEQPLEEVEEESDVNDINQAQ